MKTKTLSLMVLLLAGAAQAAFAQNDQNPEARDHGGRAGAQAHGHPAGQPPAAPNAPQARSAPAAPPAPQGFAHGWYRGGGQPGAQPAAPAAQPQPPRAQGDSSRFQNGGRPGGWSHQQAGPAPQPQPQPPRADGGNRFQNGGWARQGDGRGDPRGGDDRGRPDDRRWSDDRRPDGDRRWDNDRRGDRDWQGDHRSDGRGWQDRDDRGRWEQGRHDGPRWAPHVYPPSYRSAYRYRGPDWVAPRGYYARAWRFGEYLPRAWYAPDYQLLDWWNFALPEPPPGLVWVRVGADALLVDGYSGQILQVVRYVFW